MKWILKGIGALILFALFAFLLGWVVFLLWNWLVPALFGGPAITYWQAYGLLILSRLLFGSWHKGHHHQRGPGGWNYHKGGYWRKRWDRKMAGMNPEQREAFRQRMKERCGWTWDEWNDAPETNQKMNDSSKSE